MLFGDLDPKMCNEVLALLLAKGANPNTRDAKGSTPLHQAIRGHHPMKNVKMLIDAGADANELDNEGNIPLHFIGNPTRLPRPGNGDLKEGPTGKSLWKREYKPIVQLLISHTTNIDTENDEGFSPLHFAVRGKAINTAEYLVENGADDSVRYKPLDYDSSIPSYWTQTVLGMPAWTHMCNDINSSTAPRSNLTRQPWLRAPQRRVVGVRRKHLPLQKGVCESAEFTGQGQVGPNSQDSPRLTIKGPGSRTGPGLKAIGIWNRKNQQKVRKNQKPESLSKRPVI